MRTSFSSFWTALLALLIAPAMVVRASQAGTESIEVRVINPRSGQPLKKVYLTMSTWSGPVTRTPAATTGITDSEGRVSFQLERPIPDHAAFTAPPDQFEGCSGAATFSVKDVLRNGAIAKYDARCGRLNWHGTAHPREIILFERKLRLLDKMGRELP